MPSVTIDGQPIAFDWQCKLREFLKDRLPPEELLFGRWQPQPKMHSVIVDDPEAFVPPYPSLPPIAIGELQWPSGASRYARALYLVGRSEMEAIAVKAWNTTSIPAGGLVDVLSDWGRTQAKLLRVVVFGDSEQFEADMLPLAPLRVPGHGGELWMLPLVDDRFLKQQLPYDGAEGSLATWAALFTNLATTLGHGIAYGSAIPSEYGIPDKLTIKPGITAAALLDCAALSISRRLVVDPIMGAWRLMTATESDSRSLVTIAKPTLIAGGFRGKAVVPSNLAVYCREAYEMSLACDRQVKRVYPVGSGSGTFTHLAHSAWVADTRLVGGTMTEVNSLATGYYVEKLADDLEGWLNSEGQYAFSGAISYAPSGYDDYMTIRTAETDCPEEYTFHSRVYELPSVFLPNLLLSQTPSLVVASLVDQFTAEDQGTDPGKAYHSGLTALRVAIIGLAVGDTGATVTAFYRCGIGWTKIAAGTVSGGSATNLHVFTLTADLAATLGSTATANIAAANTIGGGTTSGTVVNSGKFRAFNGATGLAAKLATDAFWILHVDQPALRVLVKLNDPNSSPGAIRYGADPRETNAAIRTSSPAPQALTPYPFGFMPSFSTGLIPNPQKLFGEDGDMAVIAWDKATDWYFLEEVFPQRQQELWVKLAADRPTGIGATVSCTPATPNSDGAWPSSPFNAIDLFNVAINAKSNHEALVSWDAGAAGYRVIGAKHTATRVKGTLNGNFAATPTTFSVNVVAGMDGIAPTGPLTVENRFGWPNGNDGAEVEVWHDSATGTWYATQMKWSCP